MGQLKHSGRYPDLLNPDAVKSFLEIMHPPISVESCGLAEKARGLDANEPHLMQLHWIMADSPFACVSWNAEIPAKFEAMHGYDLMPQIPRLFAGDDFESRRPTALKVPPDSRQHARSPRANQVWMTLIG
jgi:hypothetical protein